ncbi:MAG: 3'(2'),5'-bisphosphate nucleotidase [Nitrospirae bacterium]|nr:MAG: 3'(2'),5'-bisphosphate nucleotidase [Nitrospirota bacterium]
MGDKTDYETVLRAALRAALIAGEAILDVYEGEFDVEKKADDSPLTIADQRAHRLISNSLHYELPDIPILSEEGRDIPYSERSGWKRFFLVDPLDGTKEFIKRNGEFTVNIALIEGESPVLGVIYIPFKEVFYFSIPGEGAFRGDIDSVRDYLITDGGVKIFHRIGVSSERVGKLVIAGSRSHGNERQERFISEMKKRYGDVEFMPAGSSLKFCLIAEGRVDVYPRYGPTMEWDTAAGQAVVEAAGGRVLEMKSLTPLRYNKEDLHNPWFVVDNGKMGRFEGIKLS